ncbi:hypothetical protein ACQ3G6_13235 [Allorhizobium undicola]|uniref:hypothetical protein n=1 Tax=Allorhizobium undicola TaxID=78527 RepID=UPI003D34A53D
MEAGQPPSDFWSLTLREIMHVLAACKRRRQFEHSQHAWLAHTVAFLTAYAPEKAAKFPKLEKLLPKVEQKPKAAPHWRDVLAKVKAWAKG